MFKLQEFDLKQENLTDLAIQINNMGKMYQLFPNPLHKILSVFGLKKILGKSIKYQDFWALRGINLQIKKGERIGLIGSNGAGKSTLLKTITGNTTPTEGDIQVQGRIQALMELGTGFHPDFTGRQNIRASLAYQDIDPQKLPLLEQDIIEFTELEHFIDQPVKTYSAGMYARLAFATATAIEPEILIIDEVLGVGDAYFLNRCTERMKKLTTSGTTLLLVSHSTAQILQFCDRVIWIDRGRVIKDGSNMEVVSAYERYNRVIENRRLIAKNIKKSANFKPSELESYSDSFLLKIKLKDSQKNCLKISNILLWKDGKLLDELLVGHSQDASYMGHSCYLVLEHQSWSQPQEESSINFRSIIPSSDNQEAIGVCIFNLYLYQLESNYEIEVEYIYSGEGEASVELYNSQEYVKVVNLIGAETSGTWQKCRASLPPMIQASQHQQQNKWPGTGELQIQKVFLLNHEDQDTAIFTVGDLLKIQVQFQCNITGNYPITFCVIIYRDDGLRVSCHLSEEKLFDLQTNEIKEACMSLSNLNLGNGNYCLALALYKTIDRQAIRGGEYYDLISWSYEFKVVGNDAIDQSIFHHPEHWIF